MRAKAALDTKTRTAGATLRWGSRRRCWNEKCRRAASRRTIAIYIGIIYIALSMDCTTGEKDEKDNTKAMHIEETEE